MKKTLVLLALLTLTASCIKTAEQARREKRMDDQLNDSQGLVADLTDKVRELQGQIDRLNGRIEELEHRQKQPSAESRKTEETLALIKSQQETESTQILQIQNDLKEQRSFLEKVTAQLGNLHSTKTAPNNHKKKSPKEELAEALSLVQNNKFDEARNSLEPLIDHAELSPGDQNKVLHGLGRTEYYSKNYEKALVYFSKIFSKYPKSSLAPSSLLYIGKSLKRLGKKEEAKEALSKVIEDYPRSQEAIMAKKDL